MVACVIALVVLVTALVHVWEVTDVHLEQETCVLVCVCACVCVVRVYVTVRVHVCVFVCINVRLSM